MSAAGGRLGTSRHIHKGSGMTIIYDATVPAPNIVYVELPSGVTAAEAQHRLATWPVIAAALTDTLEWLESVPGGLGDSAKISYLKAREAIAAAEKRP